MPQVDATETVDPNDEIDEPYDYQSGQELTYRPVCKLTPEDEDTFEGGWGWHVKVYRDARGNLYERNRRGQMERWVLITERRKNGQVIYQSQPPYPHTSADLEEGDCVEMMEAALGAALQLFEQTCEPRLRNPIHRNSVRRVKRLLLEISDAIGELGLEVRDARPPDPDIH